MWSRSGQPSLKMEASGGMFRRHILYSHTSPPSQPHPRTRSHLCTRKSISASCSSEVHSTAHQHTRLYTPSETLSLLFDRQRNPAASGNNPLFVPLDKKFLCRSCPQCSHCCTHSRAAPVQRACTFHACT